ncbi:MAG: alpha/beta hydrolase [Anaerolineae bacterium]|nr:alpha/beta hydrolase [Anaerolineae bacterium]
MTAIQTSTNLHYTTSGTGPDVLLIHGWASSGQMWSRLTRDLQHRARFWSVDLYGFGQSPRPLGDEVIEVDHHKDMLLEFCDHYRLRPRLVIGHSMGGMLTLKLAAENPALMERLVLISPVVTGRFGYPLELNRLLSTDWANFTLSRSKPFWMLAQNVLSPIFSRPAHWYLDEEAAQRILIDFQRASWQASTYALQSIARENLHPHLPAVHHPTLVIVGSRDTTVPPDEARLAARELPHGHLLELPTAHHQPLDEQPQQVVSAIADFLAA